MGSEIHYIEIIELLLYLAVCIGIGVYFSKRSQSSEEEYWVAGHFLNKTWGAFAIYAVVGSASTIMGSAGIGYQYGLPVVMAIALGFSIQFPLVANITAGPLLEHNICTLGDFFQDRIGGKHIRLLYSILSLVFMAAYVVPNMKAGALVGQYLLGDKFNYTTVAIIIGVVLVIYSAIGGMWAVTVTDIIQGVLMMSSVVLLGGVIFLTSGEFGGVAGLLETAISVRPSLAEMGYKPLSMIGLAFTWGLFGLAAPMTVMRVLTMSNGRSARRSLTLGAVFAAVTVIVAGFIAAVAATIEPNLENADMSYIITMNKYFPSFISGFFIAAIFAAIMSSVDSYLLSCSATVARDIYKTFINPKASEKKIIHIGMIALVVIGAITTIISTMTLPLVSVISGLVAGGLISAFCAPIVIGLSWKGTSRNGVFWSMLFGGVGYIVLNRSGLVPSMSEILIIVPLSALVCVVVSKLSPNKETA